MTQTNAKIRIDTANKQVLEPATEIPNKETSNAIENISKGIGLSSGFHSVSELIGDLSADN